MTDQTTPKAPYLSGNVRFVLLSLAMMLMLKRMKLYPIGRSGWKSAVLLAGAEIQFRQNSFLGLIENTVVLTIYISPKFAIIIIVWSLRFFTILVMTHFQMNSLS